MSKRIVKLTESDLEKIVNRVIKEQEGLDFDIMGKEDEEEVGGTEITLDQIAMLLKDGECTCGGQRLVLNLNGTEEGEEEVVDDEVESDYDEEL